MSAPCVTRHSKRSVSLWKCSPCCIKDTSSQLICFHSEQNNILRTHLRTHSDLKGFSCDLCGTSFRTKGSLIRHNRRHTGRRGFIFSSFLKSKQTFMLFLLPCRRAAVSLLPVRPVLQRVRCPHQTPEGPHALHGEDPLCSVQGDLGQQRRGTER